MMSTITASVYLHVPLDRVREYLREGLARASQAGAHRIQLFARLPATPVDLSKEVAIESTAGPENVEGPWPIRWRPEPGGTYPSFEGNLSAHRNAHDDKTILELSGSYAPPLGAAGRAFDHILGHKLSDDTAHTFLMNIAAEMRARYAYEEAIREFSTWRRSAE